MQDNPEGGLIVHVPHINDGMAIFNKSLAGAISLFPY
jgi:hypothetical protein